MSLHFIILLLVLSSPTMAYEYPYKSCQGDDYTTNSVFKSNLNLLLSSLSSPNSTYGTDTKGSAPNIAYGLFLCRGDISLSECRNCIKNATQGILQLCPNSKEATVWYETCQLRYSDLSFFTSYYDDYPKPVYNGTINNDTETFTKLKQELLNKLSVQAANNSSLLFATGTASTTGNHKPMIYGMAQCTRDLSGPKCYQCLQENFSNFLKSFGAQEGGMVLSKSCTFRYEVYKFFEGEPTISLALPPSSPPVPSLPLPSPNQEDHRKGNRNVIIISVVISIVIVFLVIFAVRIFCRRTSAQNSHGTADSGEISTTESLYLDLSVLKAATANFSDVNKLGQGGFGAVYKGILPHGEDIAVKRLSAHSKQGIQELKNEIVLIAKLQHRNLVRVRGVCLEEGERLLVYEYMPNGSLDKFLFDPNKCKELNWERRFKIIGGIARGLLYLHEESHLKVVHRDLKSSNILLDANMKPKISDFGLARLFARDETHAITCKVVGTIGYMSPEYARRGQFSTKLDVYSYGILVLEIVTGRNNNAFKYDSDHGLDLPGYAWKHWRSGRALEIIDKSLGEDYSRNEAFRCIKIGLLCAQEVPVDRPSMSSVFLMLNSRSMPLQDPLPPALLTGSFGSSQLGGHSNSPNPPKTDQKGKEKVQSDSIRTFSSGTAANIQPAVQSKEGRGEPLKEIFLPHSQAAVDEREKLVRTLGVVVLGYGETEVEKCLDALREMSETFRTRKWNPIPCGPREFVIEFPNENALEHLLSRPAWPCRGGGSCFHVNRWNGEEGIPIHRFPLQAWVEVKGLPLFMWDRATFIAITKEFGQLLDVDKKTLTKEEKTVARIRIGCESEAKIPERRTVIIGDRRCDISFTIRSRTVDDGAVLLQRGREREEEEEKRREED